MYSRPVARTTGETVREGMRALGSEGATKGRRLRLQKSRSLEETKVLLALAEGKSEGGSHAPTRKARCVKYVPGADSGEVLGTEEGGSEAANQSSHQQPTRLHHAHHAGSPSGSFHMLGDWCAVGPQCQKMGGRDVVTTPV